jgi:hypothetical protein
MPRLAGALASGKQGQLQPAHRSQGERGKTARTLGRKTGGAKRLLERRQPIAYEPLQEPSELFGF